MKNLVIVATENGNRIQYDINRSFIASEKPLYIGVITKPEPGLWNHLSTSRSVVMEVDGKASDFKIPYRIEVGESTIFFLTPETGESMPDF